MLAVCVLELLYLKFKFNFMNKDTHEVFTEDGGAAGEWGGVLTSQVVSGILSPYLVLFWPAVW